MKLKKIWKIIFSILICCVVFIVVFLLYWFRNPFVKEYTIEAGHSLTIEELLKENNAREPKFITEINEDVLNKVGTHTIQLSGNNNEFELLLTVEDTIAPVVQTKSYHYFIGDEFDANQFVDKIEDFTTVSVKMNDEINFKKNGSYEVNLSFVDEGNNITTKKAKLKVEKDITAPVIKAPDSITIKKGDSILYKKLISVTDNRDGKITDFEIDSSNVNFTRVGKYSITITATDANKNTSSKSIPVIIELKNKAQAKEEAKSYAKDILKKITNSSMTKEQKLKSIYKYVKKTYKYNSLHEGTINDYYIDALNGLMTNQGDCYVVNAMARCLMEEAGIKTVGVFISDGKYKNDHITFMANTGNGWYHYSCMRKSDKVDIYKWTDAQYLEYGKRAYHIPNMDLSKYPNTPDK